MLRSTGAAWVLACGIAASWGAVSAADRHVYLDRNADGQLNDCPNPAHNAKGIAGNTDEVSYCAGGASDGKVIGTVAGTVSASVCSSGGGAVTALRNGLLADVDRDGVRESVYGHPQACVFNMAKSDSCEVHAGTYKKAGAQCDEDCGNQSQAGLEGTPGVCDKFDCFLASFVALGDGPNLDGTGYGTAAAPGWVRAAQVNGSIDSWDPNGDKDPADGLYPAVLSGDANGNAAFDKTVCTGRSCSGDAFYGAIVGCGGSPYGQHFCRATAEANSTYIRIDSDADGSFDRNVGVFSLGSKKVHNLRIKDLVFTGYNGGNGAIDGTRPKPGTIDLNGDGATDGLVVDHIYLHANDFTLGLDNVSADRVSNEGYTENHWSAFNDHTNSGCTTPTQIQNSFLVQNNARLLNFDCGVNISCGCEIYFHDNRVLVDVDPAKVPTYTDPANGNTKTRSIVIGYYKNIDANPRQHRLWNNEFVFKRMGTSRGYFMDLQGFGNAQGGGNGSLWVYGNLFRYDPSASPKMNRFWQGFCDIQTSGYEYYLVNNTFDMDSPMDRICDSSGDLVVERNNAFLRMTALFASTATVTRRSNNATSTLSSDRSVWFDPGSFAPGAPGTHGGLTNYRPRAGGPLDGAGSCDPDGDGVKGFDWNGDGAQETVWRDLAGNTVDCTATGAALAEGAVQRGAPSDPNPPATVQNLRRTDRR